MLRAIISDIHSNVEALDAVLADVARRKVESIVCLGDVIGYGVGGRPTFWIGPLTTGGARWHG